VPFGFSLPLAHAWLLITQWGEILIRLLGQSAISQGSPRDPIREIYVLRGGYQLDGAIRPCHQSWTPRDWYWCSLVEQRGARHYPLLTMALTRWRDRRLRSPAFSVMEHCSALSLSLTKPSSQNRRRMILLDKRWKMFTQLQKNERKRRSEVLEGLS